MQPARLIDRVRYDTRARLDLTLNASSNGFSEDSNPPGDTNDQPGSRSDSMESAYDLDNPAYSALLEFSTPLENRTEHPTPPQTPLSDTFVNVR